MSRAQKRPTRDELVKAYIDRNRQMVAATTR
jgi:hypothetical protein